MKQRDVRAILLGVATVLVVTWYLTSVEGTSDVDDPDDNVFGIFGLDSAWANTFGSIGAIVSAQTVSDAGISLIQQYEACQLTAYWDVNGYSIGWGHHTLSVTSGQTCTQAQADAWLSDDANAAACAVLKYARVSLTQNQLDALTDWIYNLGETKVAGATLWSVLNSGNYSGVPAQLQRWCNVNGSPDSGLQARRQAECDLWNGGGN